MNLQGALFAVLAQSVIIAALILALTNYLDASPSFTCGFLLNLYGLYGIEVIDLARRGSNREFAVLADFLWSIGPHLHFADFTSRLTFFWGALPLSSIPECVDVFLRHPAVRKPDCSALVEISKRLAARRI